MEHANVDMILHNGTLITVDKNETPADAVAVKDGRIVEVGSNEEIKELKGKKTEVLDLKKKTVLPGFIDAHTHLDLVGFAFSDVMVDCHIPPVKSVDEILSKIKERRNNTPKGELIIGHGRFNQPYPTKKQLDEVAPNHPVIVKNSMHAYILNSFALRKYHITKERPTPEELFRIDPGAIIYRDPATGEPTGYVEECWNYLFPNSCSPFPYETTKSFIKGGLNRFSKAGVTSVTDFVDFPETLRVYQDLYNNGNLPIRMQVVPCVHGLYKTVDLDPVINLGLRSFFGNDWLRFMGVKIFVDRGHVTTLASVQLNEMVLKAHEAGLRLYLHAISRKAQDMALEAIENAEKAIPGKNLRHRIEHMGNDYHDPGYFDRLKKIGAIPLPTAYFIGIGPQEWLQPKGDRAYPFKTLLDKGLCVPGNSDSGGSEPEAYNPLYEIWCMVVRKSKEGEPVYLEEKISVMDAIRIYTIHSAYAGFDEDVKGSIEPGKMADFAILAENPLTIPEDDLKDIPVDMTIVGGKIVHPA
jgi:predicted amidohydrolase YtcJ